MFGVTTPCVTAVREILEPEGFDTLVFHATGVGGRAMEELAGSSLLDGVLDITTTEVADEVVGGVSPAAPRASTSCSSGACPMCCRSVRSIWSISGAVETVPEKFRGPQAPCPQRRRHADAHDGRGKYRMRPLDRAQTQCAS